MKEQGQNILGEQRVLPIIWWAWRQRCRAEGSQAGFPGYDFILEMMGGGDHGRALGKGMTGQILERTLWPGWGTVNRVTAFVSPHLDSSLQVAFFPESKILLLWESRVQSTWELPLSTSTPSFWRAVPAVCVVKAPGDAAAETSRVCLDQRAPQ